MPQEYLKIEVDHDVMKEVIKGLSYREIQQVVGMSMDSLSKKVGKLFRTFVQNYKGQSLSPIAIQIQQSANFPHPSKIYYASGTLATDPKAAKVYRKTRYAQSFEFGIDKRITVKKQPGQKHGGFPLWRAVKHMDEGIGYKVSIRMVKYFEHLSEEGKVNPSFPIYLKSRLGTVLNMPKRPLWKPFVVESTKKFEEIVNGDVKAFADNLRKRANSKKKV